MDRKSYFVFPVKLKYNLTDEYENGQKLKKNIYELFYLKMEKPFIMSSLTVISRRNKE